MKEYESCDDPNFDPAENFTGRLDHLEMFLMITKIPTNYYSLTKEWGCSEAMLDTIRKQGLFHMKLSAIAESRVRRHSYKFQLD